MHAQNRQVLFWCTRFIRKQLSTRQCCHHLTQCCNNFVWSGFFFLALKFWIAVLISPWADIYRNIASNNLVFVSTHGFKVVVGPPVHTMNIFCNCIHSVRMWRPVSSNAFWIPRTGGWFPLVYPILFHHSLGSVNRLTVASSYFFFPP